MAQAKTKIDIKPELVRVIKKEIVYEYVSILGGILGWWRKINEHRIGETIEIHLKHSLNQYDRLTINDVEIPIPEKALTDKINL